MTNRHPDVYFTSDTHFSHKMLVEKGHRPFDTVEEMNECLTTLWNETVRPGDQVWHLGDVFMGNEDQGLELVRNLHGEKHLILGNHDRPSPIHRDGYKHFRRWLDSFETIQSFARRRIAGRSVLLSHFPYAGAGDHTEEERYMTYRFRADPPSPAPLVHGHVHSLWKDRGLMLNVGVDVWNFTPVSLDTITQWVGNELERYSSVPLFAETASDSLAGTS